MPMTLPTIVLVRLEILGGVIRLTVGDSGVASAAAKAGEGRIREKNRDGTGFICLDIVKNKRM